MSTHSRRRPRSRASSVSIAVTRSSWRRRTGSHIAATRSRTSSTPASGPRAGRRASPRSPSSALIEEGRLEPATTARSVLGGDLPLIDDAVTVEQLLAHRSGIGDYFDEEVEHDLNDYVMPVPVHELASTEDYLRRARRTSHQVRARRAFRVLQRRLRRPGADRRAGERDAVPRARARARVRAGGNARHGVSALGRATRAHRASAISISTARRAATSSTCPSAVAATAASTRPRRTSAGSGTRSSPAGSSRPTGSARWCGRAATCRRSRCATGSASGCTRRPTRC